MCDNIFVIYIVKIDGRSLGNVEMRCFLLIKFIIFFNVFVVVNWICIYKKDFLDKRIFILELVIWYRV